MKAHQVSTCMYVKAKHRYLPYAFGDEVLARSKDSLSALTCLMQLGLMLAHSKRDGLWALSC